MAKVHAKGTVVTVATNDLSVHTNTSEFSPATDSQDVTTYGSDGHVYQGGLTNGTFTMGGFYDSTAVSGPRAVLLPIKGTSAVVAVQRQIEGTGAGLPQDAFNGLLTSYAESAPVADYVQWTAEFQISGDVDSTAQSA